MTNGAERTDYTRDERGNSITAKNSNPALSYQATKNAQGQSTSIKSETGRELSYEYDSAGRKVAFSDAQAGTFKSEYDNGGRMVNRILPSGKSYHYEYDAKGTLRKESDNKGHSLTVERDASGALLATSSADGKWSRATRDEAGRVIATTNSDGKSRHFTYNARGAITTFTNERGEQKRYEYDRRGRLKTIYQSNGKRTTIERDERGRPQRISLSTGDRLIYKYDRSGHVASIKREPSATKLTKTDFNPAKLVGANAFAQDQKDRPQTNLACSPEGPFEVFCGSIIDQPAEGQFGDFFFGDSWGGFGGFFFIYDGFYDPFFWSFNPFFSFGGESCGECISRQDQICETARSACNLKVGAEFGTSLIACAGISAVTGLIGLSVCGAVALGAETLGLLACNNDFDACNLAVLDKCPQCRN